MSGAPVLSVAAGRAWVTGPSGRPLNHGAVLGRELDRGLGRGLGRGRSPVDQAVTVAGRHLGSQWQYRPLRAMHPEHVSVTPEPARQGLCVLCFALKALSLPFCFALKASSLPLHFALKEVDLSFVPGGQAGKGLGLVLLAEP